LLAVWLLDGDLVLFVVGGDHGCIAALFNAVFLAAPRVMENVVGLVSRCPASVNAGHVGSRREHVHAVILFGNHAGCLQFRADRIVDFLAAGVVGRDDQRVLRLGDIVLGDGLNALGIVGYLGDAALLLQERQADCSLVLRQVFDRAKQLRVFLAHDLVKLRSLHPGLLHLLEGLASIDALMLARVADKKHSILRPDLLHECLHLAGAGQTGFINHIEVAAVGIAAELLLAAACKKALQSASGEASVAQLSGGAAGRGEALDRVTAALCALPNCFQSGGLAAPGESLQTVYAVAAGQHFLDGSALCRIQEFARGRVSCCRFLRHHRLDDILAALHVADGRKLRRDGLAGGELPSRLVLLPWCDLELAAAMTLLEVVAYLAVSEVTHAAPQCVAHDRAFVCDGLPFKAAILGKGDSFLRSPGRIRYTILLQRCGAFSGLCDNAVGLIAKVIRNLPMSGEHFGRRKNILLVACVVRGNLRGLRPTEAALCDGLFDLLAARAGRLKILRRVSLYVWRATLASLDLVAEIAKPEGQFRLIDSGCKLLRVEESALL
jgi:hypothetical protein